MHMSRTTSDSPETMSEEKDSHQRSPRSSSTTVSLRDVLTAHPLEDPAETKLLRSLEEGSNSSIRRQLVGPDETGTVAGEPTTVKESDDQENGKVLGGGEETPAHIRHRHRRTPTVEDELAQLATHLGAATESSSSGSIQDNQRSLRQIFKTTVRDPNVSSFDRDAAKLLRQATKGRETTTIHEVQQELPDGKPASPSQNDTYHGLNMDDTRQNLLVYEDFKSFMAFRKRTYMGTLRTFVLYSILPFGGIAALLFYGFPETADVSQTEQASVSWWLIFIGVRQVLTLILAKFLEDFLINFLAVQTKVALNTIGPFFTLMLVQSKGWPFQLFAWASLDFALLYGRTEFAHHWLFFLEDYIELFSPQNPSGKVVQSDKYRALLITCLFVSSAIAAKRFFLGLWYGQSVYRRYGQDLSNVMKKMLLIQKVAALAKDKRGLQQGRLLHVSPRKYPNISEISRAVRDMEGVNGPGSIKQPDISSFKFIIDTNARNQFAGGELRMSQKLKIADLLGDWEEPTVFDKQEEEAASISAVVNFRAAMSVVNRSFPFSPVFGKASTREECIDSAQRLFLRLKAEEEEVDDALQFDLLAVLALNKENELDEEKLKPLIEVFRPTRDGELTMLDFVKSIDTVYKEWRILEASVENVRKLNRASQEIFDAFYHTTVFCIALAMIGLDPLALLTSLTAFVVGLAFMIGRATSNWFEGMLFMLVRKPFDIGDRIAVSAPDTDPSPEGSSGWIVKDVNLYYTTVIYATTLEEATYSNFSLSALRIINHNRSPKAFLNFVVRVGIATPTETIEKFAQGIKDYVKDRPREWLNFSAFRLSDVQVQQGYVEYKVLLTHREGWQQIAAILNSKAAVQMHGYELSRKLGMDYESPPRPIIIRNQTRNTVNLESEPQIGVGVEH